jgi:hypothetical protein
MNLRLFEQLAAQHIADARQQAVGGREHIGRSRAWQQALRARTGWTLVDLGLKLVAQPHRHSVPRPRTAGS